MARQERPARQPFPLDATERERLEEDESVIEAIRQAAVDALVVSEQQGEAIYRLLPAAEVQQIDALQQRIKELEQFAAVLAHDLRSPLVTISGCAELLAEHVPAADHGLLDTIVSTVHAMAERMQSVQDYARLGAAGFHLRNVDISQVLQVVLSNLSEVTRRAEARITWGRLSSVYADEQLLAVVLQNLLENALKYRGPQRPEIRVSSQSGSEYCTIAVRDNGVGIAPADAESIFDLYQRTPAARARAAGCGIGLATCKKIIGLHGGRIWVESAPGKGATFFFTLPRARS